MVIIYLPIFSKKIIGAVFLRSDRIKLGSLKKYNLHPLTHCLTGLYTRAENLFVCCQIEIPSIPTRCYVLQGNRVKAGKREAKLCKVIVALG